MSLTVIIPVFNGENYLERAIQSCLIQPEITEIIIINDGSTDGTLEICTRFQNQFPAKIKIYSHSNMGTGYSMNLGIKNASSNYLAFLGHDDYYEEQAFISISKELNENSKDGFYLPVLNQIDQNLTNKFPVLKNEVLSFEKTGITSSKILDLEDYLNGSSGYLTIIGFILSRAKILENEITFERSKRGQEHDFIIHTLLKLDIEYRQVKPKIIRHLHGNNITLTTNNIPNHIFNLLKKWVLDAPGQKIGKMDLRVLFYHLLKWTPASQNIKPYYIRQAYRLLWGSGFLLKHPKIGLRML